MKSTAFQIVFFMDSGWLHACLQQVAEMHCMHTGDMVWMSCTVTEHFNATSGLATSKALLYMERLLWVSVAIAAVQVCMCR